MGEVGMAGRAGGAGAGGGGEEGGGGGSLEGEGALAAVLFAVPPWMQPRGKWMVSLVNSYTNTTSKRRHLWEIDLRFALISTPGWGFNRYPLSSECGTCKSVRARFWPFDVRGKSFGVRSSLESGLGTYTNL